MKTGSVQSYEVVRFYESGRKPEVLATRMTLEEAQAWCRDKETSSSTCTTEEGIKRTRARGRWFDGFREEAK